MPKKVYILDPLCSHIKKILMRKSQDDVFMSWWIFLFRIFKLFNLMANTKSYIPQTKRVRTFDLTICSRVLYP